MDPILKQALTGAGIGAAIGVVYCLIRDGAKPAYAAPPPPPRAPRGNPVTKSPFACTPGSGSGGAQPPTSASCAMTFPGTDTVSPAYQAYVLQKIKNGDYEIDWHSIVSVANGHKATFWVSTDGLKIDGVRINVSAALQQQIADMSGTMSLMTPKLVDLATQQADIRLTPIFRPITSSVSAMIDQNKKIDDVLVAHVGSLDATKGMLIANTGKYWVLDNGMIGKLGDSGLQAAVNYGWFYVPGTLSGVPADTPVTRVTDRGSGKALVVVQAPSTHHDYGHSDYSQQALFVLKDVILDNGAPTTLEAVLSDPTLAPLASHQGVVRVLRQPGVAQLPPLIA
jgi:hypothetical protein